MLCDYIIVCGTQYVKTFFHAYIFKYYISEYQNLSVNRLRKLNGLILVRSAFENCINLTSVTVSSSKTEILDKAFNGCEKLESFYTADGKKSGEINDYAKESVLKMVEAGVITGYDDGAFRPANEATRAEAAVMVYRLLSR